MASADVAEPVVVILPTEPLLFSHSNQLAVAHERGHSIMEVVGDAEDVRCPSWIRFLVSTSTMESCFKTVWLLLVKIVFSFLDLAKISGDRRGARLTLRL